MNITKDQSKIIKAVAILMVVLYHFQYDLFGGTFLVKRGEGIISWVQNSFEYIQSIDFAFTGLPMYFGFIGVNIFLVLSGYGLTKKYFKKDKIVPKEFGKQILKLLIPYWIAHPLMHFFDWLLKSSLFLFGVIDYQTHFWSMHGIERYVKSLLVFPRWFSNDYSMIFNGTWWFVGVIIQLYLVFPILLKVFKKISPTKALLSCIGLGLIYRLIISLYTDASPVGVNEAQIFYFINFPARLPEFALGIYLAIDNRFEEVKYKNVIGGLSLLIGFITLHFKETMFISDLLLAFGGVILLASFARKVSGIFKTGLEKIGEKSYYLYLYHEPLMKILLKFIFPGWIDY